MLPLCASAVSPRKVSKSTCLPGFAIGIGLQRIEKLAEEVRVESPWRLEAGTEQVILLDL